MMSDQELHEMASAAAATKAIQEVCDELVALANQRGGYDNITVQLIRVFGVAPRATSTLAQGPTDVVAGAKRPRTVAQGPTALPPATGSGPESAAVSTAATDIASPEPTVLEEPAIEGEDEPTQIQTRLPTSAHPPDQISTTKPGAPAPRAVEATLDDGGPPPAVVATTGAPPPGATAGVSPPVGPQPPESEQGNNPLIYVVLAMAATIGILVAVLIWALAFR